MPRVTRSQLEAATGSTRSRDKDPAIAIGIDFGTTYSGVAWARSGKPEQINIVTNWNALLNNNFDKEKAPSAIAYKSNNESPSWGYSIPVDKIPLKWFKLCLLDDEDIPEHIRNSNQIRMAKNLLRQFNRHVVEVIGDYLRELWSHSIESIERAIGKQMMGLSKFNIVVTLPAIWPAYAQARMRQAIEMAGILDIRSAGDTTLTFISEPEAAALATIEDMSDRADVNPNDHFIVCDAGGGTVDIITYTVLKIEPMTVRESVKGDGKLCGATFVDERFLRLLRSTLPRDIWGKLGERGVARLMNDEWENGIKTQFCGDGRKWQIQIPFGGTIRDHFHPPEINIGRDDILEVFRPVTTDIVQLVNDQISEVKKKFNKSPKFVILVGGFGRSQYLYTCLEEAVKNKVEILQDSGARPWTAVCRGAAIKGLNRGRFNNSMGISVNSRIARASYGTICNILPWETNVHHIRDKAWCPIQQDFLAVDQTRWFLRIGETISEDEPITHTFWQDLENADDEIVTELVYSRAVDPPKRCDDTVKELCRVRWSSIPDFDKLPPWQNAKGKTFRQICYEIKMVANGVSLDFEIFHEGKIVASKHVAVDFKDSLATFRQSEDDSGDYTD